MELTMQSKTKEISSQLSGAEPTLVERTKMLTGADYWSTAALNQRDVRPVRMSDGPHGLRIQNDDNPDHLGLGRSDISTCFPPAVTLAASWDEMLIVEIGSALGAEARARGVGLILGPGMNLKRSPLCGRNFEYFSEDPLLTGKLAAAMIKGIQSQGVGSCIKHFAVNNQETERLRVSAEIDERTLREVYLRGFEIAIEQANPWAVMSAYNKVNGTYASENEWLLTKVLRDEWRYDGVVVSDWGGVNDPVAALRGGLDVRMPGKPEDTKVLDAIRAGHLEEELVERAISRVHRLDMRTRSIFLDPGSVDFGAHHALVRRAARESAVLLKNDQAILPLDLSREHSIAVIGSLATQPRYQGVGSSVVNCPPVLDVFSSLSKRASTATQVHFAPGYIDDEHVDPILIEQAAALAKSSDVTLLIVGLPSHYEAEGSDRHHIDLPTAHLALIEAVGKVASNVVVGLVNGSVVRTAPWAHYASSIVEFWLTGQAHGEAIADVLDGTVNPSGKLPETVPARLEDTPSYLNFPGDSHQVHYGEGIFVGYRYFDARQMSVDYPFGHGLSYTSFDYSNLVSHVHDACDEIALTLTLNLRNCGKRNGAEVVQLYIQDHGQSIQVPKRELRAFAKVPLIAGETKQITLQVPRKHLEHFYPGESCWAFVGGDLTLHVGSSSRDIRLNERLFVPGTPLTTKLNIWATFREWLDDPTFGPQLQQLIDDGGGIKGRVGDLLSDEASRHSIMSAPLKMLLEFPAFPVTEGQAVALLADS